jgi:uncharacterized membrane protein
MPHDILTLLIRWLHVAAMALALGGALLLWFTALRPAGLDPAAHARTLLLFAERYERLFWLALGLLVMTGVGNLGAFGAALPAPGSAWGQRLGLKLLAVLLLSVLSLVRTLVVIRLGAASPLPTLRAARLVPALYAGTALALVTIVLLAVALAHA